MLDRCLTEDSVKTGRKDRALSFNRNRIYENGVTLFSADKADDIEGPISYEVTENSVHITWQEPAAANGMIILYEVNYKRLGDTEVKKHTTHTHICTHICTYICHAFYCFSACSDLSHWVTECMSSV